MNKRRKKFQGPHGWYVMADRDEVFPDEPGLGTPLMLYAPFGRGGATFLCAEETGEVASYRDGGYIEIPRSVAQWMSAIAVEAEEFVWPDEEKA